MSDEDILKMVDEHRLACKELSELCITLEGQLRVISQDCRSVANEIRKALNIIAISENGWMTNGNLMTFKDVRKAAAILSAAHHDLIGLDWETSTISD